MRARTPLLVLVLLLGMTVHSAPARAQGSDAALATELFNAGRGLMDEKNFAAACPKLAQSARLDAKVGTLARLAECEEKVGQMVPARGHWLQATNLARAENDGRLAHVQAELARVDKLVPKVNVSLAGPLPSGLSLLIDGLDAGAASLGLPLPVEAGRHAVVVTADGKKPFTTTIETKGDGAVTPVSVPPLEDAPPASVALAPPPLVTSPATTTTAVSYWSTQRKVGVSVAAVGVGTLAVGAVFGLLAKVELDKSNGPGGCNTNNVCPGASNGERTTAFADGTIGTVFLIAGGAVAATGLTVFLVAPKTGEASGSRAAVRVGPGSLAVSGSF